MEGIIRNLIVSTFFLFSNIQSQSYSISIFGYEIANLLIESKGPEENIFSVNSIGLADFIWPTNNNYNTVIDSSTFHLKEYHYKINQMNSKKEFILKRSTSKNLIYNKKDTLSLDTPFHNFFTLITLLKKSSPRDLDIKWYPYESFGILGRARFIWADSSNLFNTGDSIMCDHYRLDIEFLEKDIFELNESDHLINSLISDSSVRELWISKEKEPRVLLFKLQKDFLTFDVKILQKNMK